MQIIRDLSDITAPFEQAVVTLGNFDGVHLGHRAIFRTVVEEAARRGGTAVVCTFQPHPLKVLAPQHAPLLINTASERERLIAASCVDVLLMLPFTRALAALTPRQFVEQILLDTIGVKHLVVGYDYAFGRGRSGSVDFLREQGEKHGFTVQVFGQVCKNGQVCSSTRVRNTILSGNVDNAVAILGRQFNFEGVVVHGDGRGRELGFATANLETDKELLPCSGVYAAMVRHEHAGSVDDYQALVNIGTKPTFGAHPLTIEAHILDLQRDLYGEKLRVYFVKRLRDEQRFPDKDALIRAIKRDVQRARDILDKTDIVEYREYLHFDRAAVRRRES